MLTQGERLLMLEQGWGAELMVVGLLSQVEVALRGLRLVEEVTGLSLLQ